MAGSAVIRSVETLFLDKPPCCLEFYSHDPQYFVVGTYNLLDTQSNAEVGKDTSEDLGNSPASQSRDGSLILCKIDEEKM